MRTVHDESGATSAVVDGVRHYTDSAGLHYVEEEEGTRALTYVGLLADAPADVIEALRPIAAPWEEGT